jgi:hypothetical protein
MRLSILRTEYIGIDALFIRLLHTFSSVETGSLPESHKFKTLHIHLYINILNIYLRVLSMIYFSNCESLEVLDVLHRV